MGRRVIQLPHKEETMQQVAQIIWNRIAATGKVQNPEWLKLFNLPPEKIDQEIDKIWLRMKENGEDPTVATAYLQLAPLLQEREAVQEVALQDPELPAALPELLSVDETLRVALMGYNLTEKQVKALRRLLETEPSLLMNG